MTIRPGAFRARALKDLLCRAKRVGTRGRASDTLNIVGAARVQAKVLHVEHVNDRALAINGLYEAVRTIDASIQQFAIGGHFFTLCVLLEMDVSSEALLVAGAGVAALRLS